MARHGAANSPAESQVTSKPTYLRSKWARRIAVIVLAATTLSTCFSGSALTVVPAVAFGTRGGRADDEQHPAWMTSSAHPKQL